MKKQQAGEDTRAGGSVSMEKHNRDGGKAKNTTKKMQKKKKDRKPNTKLIADDVLAHYAAALAGTSTSGKAVEKSKRKGKQQGFAPTLSDGGAAMATTANSAVHKASASDTAAGSGSGSAKSIDPRDAAIASLFSGTSVFAAAAVSKTAPAARESGDAVRRRKQPAEVVVFNDPSANLLRQSSLEKKAKRMFMSADPGKVYANQDLQVVPGMDGTTGDGDDDSDDAANDLDLRKTAQEILRLSAETMESNARRRWESGRLQQLGAKAPKRPGLPLAVHTGMARKSKEREAKKAAKDLETGMAQKKKRPRGGIRAPSGAAGKRSVKGGHWVDKSTVDDRRFSKGTLRISGGF